MNHPQTTHSAILALCLLGPLSAQGTQPAKLFLAKDLEAPVLLHSGGKPIESSTGYTCPALADLDGDGKLDLYVGHYGYGYTDRENVKFPIEEFSDKEWDLTYICGNNGLVSLYSNRSKDGVLDFAEGKYVTTLNGMVKTSTS